MQKLLMEQGFHGTKRKRESMQTASDEPQDFGNKEPKIEQLLVDIDNHAEQRKLFYLLAQPSELIRYLHMQDIRGKDKVFQEALKKAHQFPFNGNKPMTPEQLLNKLWPYSMLASTMTPLMVVLKVAQDNVSEERLRWLLKIAAVFITFGADPSIRDDTGETALHWAARIGDLGLMYKLLNNLRGNNNADALDNSGQDHNYPYTPLTLALRKQHAQVARLLMSRGAKTTLAYHQLQSLKDILDHNLRQKMLKPLTGPDNTQLNNNNVDSVLLSDSSDSEDEIWSYPLNKEVHLNVSGMMHSSQSPLVYSNHGDQKFEEEPEIPPIRVTLLYDYEEADNALELLERLQNSK